MCPFFVGPSLRHLWISWTFKLRRPQPTRAGLDVNKSFQNLCCSKAFRPTGSCENHWRSVRAQASALAPQSDPTSLCVAHSLSSNDMIFGELSLSFAHTHSLYFSLSRASSLAGLPIRVFHYAVQGNILFVCAGVYLWPLYLYFPAPAAHRQTFTLPPERISFAYA